MNAIAWLCSTCPDAQVRDGKEAIGYATKACQLTSWEDPSYVDTLAAAHAEAGDFVAAVKTQQEAIGLLDQEDYGAGYRADYEARLKLYQEGKPFHEEPPDTPPGRP